MVMFVVFDVVFVVVVKVVVMFGEVDVFVVDWMFELSVFVFVLVVMFVVLVGSVVVVRFNISKNVIVCLKIGCGVVCENGII